MEKAYDKQDLNRFFSGIKSKYVIPRPSTNILGKVTCRNGLEYIEKPYNTYGGISNFGVKVNYFVVYFVFCIYYHVYPGFYSFTGGAFSFNPKSRLPSHSVEST